MMNDVLIEREEQLESIPDILSQRDEEYCYSLFMDSKLFAACCRKGYLPMATEFESVPLFLIKCHRFRMVLRFPDLYISGSTQRLAKNTGARIRIDRDFENTLKSTAESRADSWLNDTYCDVLRDLHHKPQHGVTARSVELTSPEGEVQAAEIGYQVGGFYTSLSGYRIASGTGILQMTALARLLQQRSFAAWDLGMDVPYKRTLGAKPIERNEFLQEYRNATTQTTLPLPTEPILCDELLRGRSITSP